MGDRTLANDLSARFARCAQTGMVQARPRHDPGKPVRDRLRQSHGSAPNEFRLLDLHQDLE